MNTSNPTASRTRLGGTATAASSSLALNTGYLSQSHPFEATGIDTLTEHVLFNIGTFVDATGWANMIDAFYRTLQVNSNRVPSYTSAQLSAYVSMAMNVQVAFAELRRDLAIGTAIDSYSMSFLRDIYGTQYTELYKSFVGNRSANINEFNYLLENTRNVYPVPATSYVNVARYIFGNVFRDDSTRRGQYIIPHSVYSLTSFSFTGATVPQLADFAARLNNIHAVINNYLQGSISGVVNAKVAPQIAADITRVYGAYAYWNMQIATQQDTVTPICDSDLMLAMNFDTNGVWDIKALLGVANGTEKSGFATVGVFAPETYPRYAAFLGVKGTNLALHNGGKIDHVVITNRSDGVASESLADLMIFTSIPQILDETTGTGSDATTAPVLCSTSPAGITPACVWFNTTRSNSTTGVLEVTAEVAHIQNIISPDATTIGVSSIESIVPALWTNAFTPSIVQLTPAGAVAKRFILAEVDEVTNIEYASLKNMLVTLAQRYNDMFSMFLTKEPIPKVNLKPNASAIDVKSQKG